MRAFIAKSILVLGVSSLVSPVLALSFAGNTTALVSATSGSSVGSSYGNTPIIETEIISPYEVLKTAGTNLFSRISANQGAIEKFPHLMRDIVEEELMPSIDYRYASYRILGKHLKKISVEQRADFVQAMRHYLVRTYSIALSKYKGQEVIFEAEQPTDGKRIIAVKTEIIEQGSPTINVVFQMRQSNKTKQWKAFDMTVEGISLLSSKQAELGDKISKQGIDHVTMELAALSK
ncbi:MlaC/ttg2D family ABC transporter substrate-binding protein [Colwellia echini]|uniref:ABC transporter substrate-binding protein n=1 Tax=Colwellia echini TaxID=1982103 RepID=A0ABY3MWG7_9GAMM|nr:ABC transporter substrate-binding protein [Colwellia echini]TYK65550.1 ABC transporter substrate-binding protein [Colwellia echini]